MCKYRVYAFDLQMDVAQLNFMKCCRRQEFFLEGAKCMYCSVFDLFVRLTIGGRS